MTTTSPKIKKQGLLRSTTLVTLMTFVSRLLGFARDTLLATTFGAGAGLDAFLIAFRIPNFMRRLFAEGAFSQAFVPVLTEYQKLKSPEEVRGLISATSGTLGAILTGVSWLGIIASPLIIYIFAPGFEPGSERFVLAIAMLKITFPYLMLISLTALCGAVLNTYGYFAIPSLTPAFLNISMIGAALYLSPHLPYPIEGVAWGVLAAGVIQLLFQIPFLYQKKLLTRPRVAFKDEGVMRILKLMVPALFGVSVAQVNIIIDSMFASFLKVGTVSWLYFTDRLIDFPIGLFGAAIGTVILPHLSRKTETKNIVQFSKSIDWGLKTLLLLGIPSTLALSIYTIPMLTSCFGYGHFTPYDVIQTQKSLIALSLGVPTFMMVKVLAAGFYAHQDIKTPVRIGVYAMVTNSILCAILIWFLAHAGLALASSLAGFLNCWLLYTTLQKRGYYQRTPGWGRFILKLIVCNLILACYFYAFSGEIDVWLQYSLSSRLGHLGAELLGAVMVYLVSLYALGFRLEHFRGSALD